jgi:hypothetical protein
MAPAALGETPSLLEIFAATDLKPGCLDECLTALAIVVAFQKKDALVLPVKTGGHMLISNVGISKL